jgi:hypothetical protein
MMTGQYTGQATGQDTEYDDMSAYRLSYTIVMPVCVCMYDGN